MLLCNSSLAALFGETPEALVGSSAVDNLRRVLPQLKEVDGRRVSRPETSLTYALAVARKAERAPVEAQFKTGAWLQMTSHPVEGGGRVVIWTDISRLKNAESWLRHSEEQFRSIVEANPSPVRVADYETWEILYESPAAAALLGREWPATETHSTIDTYADMFVSEIDDPSFDAVFVGSGFATSFFLHRFLKSAPKTYRVLILERGRLNTLAWQRETQQNSDIPEDGVLDLQGAFNAQWRFTMGVGGGSNCWTGDTPRPIPNDLSMQTQVRHLFRRF